MRAMAGGFRELREEIDRTHGKQSISCVALKFCQEKAYGFVAPAFRDHYCQFSLDFCMNQADNFIVTILELIYSPSDMPRGLWRGFAFMGPVGGGRHAC